VLADTRPHNTAVQPPAIAPREVAALSSAAYRTDRYASAEPGVFDILYRALDADSAPEIGPAAPELLVIPLRDGTGAVVGGFWGCTLFCWLHVQMLFVPAPLRRQRVGTSLLAKAEDEALARGCIGARVDAFDFQAAAFYEKCGYRPFGVLHDFPPGHRLIYLAKNLQPPASR
jgi:GNAT superfamily N-acetyltransferase